MSNHYVDAVTDGGAIGDGAADNYSALMDAINTAFNNRVKSSEADAYGQIPLYVPGGNFMVSKPLSIINGFGVKLFGAGRFSTRIFNPNGTGVFKTNGCAFSSFADMTLAGKHGGSEAVFDLDWDGTGTLLANNEFRNIFFDQGGIGCRVGNGGLMGSENNFYTCRWSNVPVGLETRNYNALNNHVFGGECMSCGKGIHVLAGSVPIIHGMAFELSSEWDIYVENSANDTYSVEGCRSESQNFLFSAAAAGRVSGCTHWGPSNGDFLYSGQPWSIDACFSDKGRIHTVSGATVANSAWSRSDWIEPTQSSAIEMNNLVGAGFDSPRSPSIVHVIGQTKNGVYTPGVPS